MAISPDASRAVQSVERSVRFLTRWAKARIGEFTDFRYDFPLVRNKMAGDEGIPWISSIDPEKKRMICRIVGPPPAQIRAETDLRLDNTISAAERFLRIGSHPVVDAVTGNIQTRGQDAVGLRLHKGRILWGELHLNCMFWTLRPNEGDRLMAVIVSIRERLDLIHADPEQKQFVRNAVNILRRNAYSDEPRFALVAESELPECLQRLYDAEQIVQRWTGSVPKADVPLAPGTAEGKRVEVESDPDENLSPSRLKAKRWYLWARENIPGAEAMTISDIHKALRSHKRVDAEDIPRSADTFRRYLNKAGIKLYRAGPKAAGKSVVRPSQI